MTQGLATHQGLARHQRQNQLLQPLHPLPIDMARADEADRVRGVGSSHIARRALSGATWF